MTSKESTRRDFFRRTGCAALSMSALSAGFRKLGLINLLAQDAVSAAAAPTNYKALVCIFMSGGNDSNNMIIPNDTTRYTQYYNIRNPNGLAIQQANLLPINTASVGAFGFHPNFGIGFPVAAPYPTLHQLYNAGKVAAVTNVGSLVQPLTKAQYQSGFPRPFQLFSHSDQVRQQLTDNSATPLQNGWGGRLADRMVSLNAGSGFPLVTSVSGSSVFGIGLSTRPLAIGTGALNQVLVLNGFTASAADVARKSAFDTLRTIDRQSQMIAATSDLTQQALDIKASLVTDPVLTTQFPNTGIGNQLKQVAKVMKLNQTSPAMGLNRQIFFTSIGGFDTHQNQISGQNSLFQSLSQAMASFYQATVELGIDTKVTTFTLSDFSRTLQPSGVGAGIVGTDHGWGGHHIIMGGSVIGGNFYGTPGGNGTIFPELALGGPDATDSRARFIPSTSLDSYTATLASWFGLPPADLPIVFPLIGNFTTQNLGFLM
jgi:uncharacterized protein (DUF1501 family)